MRRNEIGLDGWLRDVAPSAELRRWFNHDPTRWDEFRRRYYAELDAKPQLWLPLLAYPQDVTLLYSARDREHNNAVALRHYLLAHTARPRTRSTLAPTSQPPAGATPTPIQDL